MALVRKFGLNVFEAKTFEITYNFLLSFSYCLKENLQTPVLRMRASEE